jgi:putative Holliday junction resolvase
MRYLGIDYGEKRWGLSYGDDIGVAVPLPAAVEGTVKGRMAHLEKVIAERRVAEIVVGYPLNMDGTEGFKAREVDRFIEKVVNRFRLRVHRADERLSTHQVERDLAKLGLPTKRNRKVRRSGDIDSRAAAVILQDFLDEATRAIRDELA